MIQSIAESSGRCFSPDEITLIRQTVKTFPNLSFKELSKTICELLEWKRSSGKLKHEECRTFLERLQSDVLVVLPKLRNMAALGPRKLFFILKEIRLNMHSTFKQMIERWQYLKYCITFGTQ